MLNRIHFRLLSCSLNFTIICDRLGHAVYWELKLPLGTDFAQTALRDNRQRRETAMDRRLFVAGLLGAGATAALGVALPRQAEALVAVPPRALSPSSGLPDLNAPDELNTPDDLNTPDANASAPDSDWKDNLELVYH